MGHITIEDIHLVYKYSLNIENGLKTIIARSGFALPPQWWKKLTLLLISFCFRTYRLADQSEANYIWVQTRWYLTSGLSRFAILQNLKWSNISRERVLTEAHLKGGAVEHPSLPLEGASDHLQTCEISTTLKFTTPKIQKLSNLQIGVSPLEHNGTKG